MKLFNKENPIIGKKFERGDVALHGDVVLFYEDLPKNFDSLEKVKAGIVALGEATGHLHQIQGEAGFFDLRLDPSTQTKFLKVIAPVRIAHQEHREIELPPGNYRIGVQREYDPWSKRSRAVVD